MEKPAILLQKAALLRDKASRARRLAVVLQDDDKARLTRFSEELAEQATELERQAAAQTPRRATEPGRNTTRDDRKPN
jgi:hypothetical protein